jgi:hypothetical protein
VEFRGGKVVEEGGEDFVKIEGEKPRSYFRGGTVMEPRVKTSDQSWEQRVGCNRGGVLGGI